MHSDKKRTKEDTWRPADLRRHIREEGRGDEHVRRRDDNERKHRGEESTERRRRDPEKESRRERDKHRERESARERRDEDEKDRRVDRRKEGSRDRRGDERDREKRRERDKLDGKRYDDDHKENGDRRRDREEKHDRERDKERHRDREKERDRERRTEEDRDKRREERDRERRREERDRERRNEGGEREKRDRHRERERHRDEHEDKRGDKERRERQEDRKHSELKEEREHKDEHRRHKEERERRHKERGHHDEKRKHSSESRQHRDLKGSGEEVRHHRGDRERAERDKHKERRHREEEEEEPERNHHRDRTSSKTSEKSHRHETKTEGVAMVSEHRTASVKDVGDTEEPVVNDDVADQEYEDDFEDYEEDFEELDESANEGEDDEERPEAGEERVELTAQRRKEIEAIQRAMDEENERVGTAQSRQSTSREEEERPKWSRGSEKNQSRASQRGKFIDFVAAKQREVSKKVATKQKKRSADLLRLIDLDFSVTFSLLDLPPVNEYDMYIRSFGTANTKQAYVQCNEDNADRDIQTEEIEVCEKWTQHPPEHSGACGDPNLSQEAQDKSDMNFDSQRLTAFLRSASQVMVVLLEEDQAERKSLRKPRSQTDTLSFSDGSLQLNTKLPFLYGRSISLVHFSQVQRHTMMSVHSPTTKPSAVRLDSCTIICIWNIWEPSRPQKVLVYESEVQCCCFSPGKAILVFAGTSVGSVALWDLREHASNHYRLKIGEDEWTFRQPTFSTDAVMAGSGHFSSVTSVEVVPSAVAGGLKPEVPLLASEEESSGLSFQLASLDESGVLNFWVG